MYSHIGKFEQRITPSSDTLYITQSAVNRSVSKDDKNNSSSSGKKKKRDGFEEHDADTVLLSQDGQSIATDIFDEHDEAWISISALYANAKARLDVVADVLMKRQLLADGMSQENLEETETLERSSIDVAMIDPKVSRAIKAYESQDHFGSPNTSHDVSSKRKKMMQEEIEQESTEDLKKEQEHLIQLIPGLETLLKAEYTHLPILPTKTFLQTVQSAVEKIENLSP